ncbi:Uncharacterized protein TCAP_02462, partial [Tolypocladium capitatum]
MSFFLCSAAINHMITNAVFNMPSQHAIPTSPSFPFRCPFPRIIELLQTRWLVILVFALSGEPSWSIIESSTAIIVANLPTTWTMFRGMFNLTSFNSCSDYLKNEAGSRRLLFYPDERATAQVAVTSGTVSTCAHRTARSKSTRPMESVSAPLASRDRRS